MNVSAIMIQDCRELIYICRHSESFQRLERKKEKRPLPDLSSAEKMTYQRDKAAALWIKGRHICLYALAQTAMLDIQLSSLS